MDERYVRSRSPRTLGELQAFILCVRGENAYTIALERLAPLATSHPPEVTVALTAEVPETVNVFVDPAHLLTTYYRKDAPDSSMIAHTDSCVRLLHLPTGIIVRSQDRSRHRNMALAMSLLRSRLATLPLASTRDLARCEPASRAHVVQALREELLHWEQRSWSTLIRYADRPAMASEVNTHGKRVGVAMRVLWADVEHKSLRLEAEPIGLKHWYEDWPSESAFVLPPTRAKGEIGH